MGAAFNEFEAFDLYDEKNPTEINLKRLASLLGLPDKDLAEALEMEASAFSRNPYASANPILNQWLAVFSLIIKIIRESESELSSELIKIKMQRWLKLPRPEFNSKSALDEMRKGRARRVKNLLEQMVG